MDNGLFAVLITAFSAPYLQDPVCTGVARWCLSRQGAVDHGTFQWLAMTDALDLCAGIRADFQLAPLALEQEQVPITGQRCRPLMQLDISRVENALHGKRCLGRVEAAGQGVDW